MRIGQTRPGRDVDGNPTRAGQSDHRFLATVRQNGDVTNPQRFDRDVAAACPDMASRHETNDRLHAMRADGDGNRPSCREMSEFKSAAN